MVGGSEIELETLQDMPWLTQVENEGNPTPLQHCSPHHEHLLQSLSPHG